jgi:hypothetical protein
MAASRRRRPFEQLVRLLPLHIMVAGMLATSPVRGAELPTNYCLLDRAPVLDWFRLATGDDCPFDEDGNGLDDAVETELARCFVPEIVFDSRENALQSDEPHIIFSADPIAPRVIRLHFALLFARDGGYVLGTEFPCLSDEHNGDAEAATVDVVWLERDRRWFGAPLTLHTLGPEGLDQRTSLGGVAGETAGTHPRLYATAGKHHWLHESASLSYACSCGPFGRCGKVRDAADGAGVRVIPKSLHHAPRFTRDTPTPGSTAGSMMTPVHPLAPLDAEQREFGNACAQRTRGVLFPARSLGSNDLAFAGYPGERIFGSCFRGGLGGPCLATVSVGEALAWDNPIDRVGRPSESSAGKLIASLLGIVGRPAPANARKKRGASGSALFAPPSTDIDSL